MRILKTDPSRFEGLQDYPFKEHYVSFNDLQMHYLDEGSGETILALHGEPSWSYLYRKFVPVLSDYRFIAPDLIGFGKSDKIVGWKNYSFDLHYQSLKNFIEKLELNNITLVVQDWGGLLGLSLLGEFPEKFKRVVIMNTFLPVGKKSPFIFKLWVWFARYHPSLPVGRLIQFATAQKMPRQVARAYDTPFPNRSYKSGARAFPSLVPSSPDDPGVEQMKKARVTLSRWTKPALVLFSDKDPIMSGLEKFFYKLIPSSSEQPKITINNAGHFLQEDKGREIARYIDRFMKGTLA